VCAVVLLAATACTGGGSDPDAAAAGSGSPVAQGSTPADPSPSRSESPASPGVPEPGSMDEPATTSGPLSRSSFPTPQQLGEGWRYLVDPGDAEEGYAGNGTPTLARSPREIVQTAVPFGCPRRTSMPAPDHALEVDYSHHGGKVIAVRTRFADGSTARAFFDGRAANLQACAGRTGGPAIGPLVSRIGEPATDALASDRTPASDPWREVAVLDGASVVLLAAQGSDSLTDPETRRLVGMLRR